MKPWGIWGIGCVVSFLIIGLAGTIAWSLFYLAYNLFKIHWAYGLLTIASGFVVFILPAIVDETVLELQIENTKALQINSDPVDLTGKTVVFLGTDVAWNRSDITCGYVCDAIVRHGGADAVLFGKGWNSYSKQEKPLDLTQLKLFSYKPPFEGSTPIISEVVPTQFETVDYVVLASARPSDAISADLQKGANSYFLYRAEVEVDYLVVPVSDPKAVNFYSQPFFSALRVKRNAMQAPYIPGTLLGKLHSRHWKVLPKKHGWINDTGYRTLEFLCGPPARAGHQECVTALDENPHY